MSRRLTAFCLSSYDCYCGVTGYDVTYNTAANPPKPYIVGIFPADPAAGRHRLNVA